MHLPVHSWLEPMPSQPNFEFNYSTLQLKSSLLKNDLFQQLQN